MANRSYDFRRHKRFVKGIKRVKEDRAAHGDIYWIRDGEPELACDCFCPDATHGKGAVFARFADTPTPCSRPLCCGNPDTPWEKDHANKVPLWEDE